MAIISVLILIAVVFFKDYATEAKMAQMQYDNRVTQGIIEEYLTTNEVLPEDLDDIDVLDAYVRGKLIGSRGLVTELKDESTYKDVTPLQEVESVNSKLVGRFAANNDGDVYYVSNETLKDEIPPAITVSEYDSSPTNGDAIICVTVNEGTLNEDCHTFTENGSFTFIATDDSKNKTEKTVTVDFIDKEAPIITVLPYETGPTNQDIQVIATIDSGFFIGPSEHTFTENGSFTFNATDTLGNASSLTVTIENIDKTAPGAPVIDVITNGGEADISIVYAETISTKEYKISTGEWTVYNGELKVTSNSTIYARETDEAGNTSTIAEVAVVLDTTPPEVAFGTNGNSTYQQGHSTTVTVTDDNAGVDEGSLKYKWTASATPPSVDGTWTSFSSGDTIQTANGLDGSYYLHVYASDNIGNDGVVSSSAFSLDNTVPVISITKNGDATAKSSHSTTVTIIDANSGIKASQYAWMTSINPPAESSTAWKDATSSITLTTPISNGTYYLHVKAEDNAGNTATFRSNGFQVLQTHTVSFQSNGGNNIPSQTLSKGSKISKPSRPTRENYSFDGWYTNSSLTTQWNFSTGTVNANLTLYARWVPYEFDYATSKLTACHNTGTTVNIPRTIDGILVRIIGTSACRNSEIILLTIPTSVHTIEANAFRVNKIGTGTSPGSSESNPLNIPSSVTTIGNGAFGYNYIKWVRFGSEITSRGSEIFKYNGPWSESHDIPTTVDLYGLFEQVYHNNMKSWMRR